MAAAPMRMGLREANQEFSQAIRSVRALDAIHIATAIIRRDAGHGGLPFLTRDGAQGAGARALELEVLGLPET